MDIKQLIYFTAIVDEGNISSAAKKLHISQPPLSSQIHNLEQELGCVLFERGARKIQLTEAVRYYTEGRRPSSAWPIRSKGSLRITAAE